MRVAGRPRWIQVLVAALLVLAGVGVGLTIGANLGTRAPTVPRHSTDWDGQPPGADTTDGERNDDPESRSVRTGGYELINPLLECERAQRGPRRELIHVDEELRAAVSRVLASGRAAHVSVYFRDLNNGPWIGINEQAEFSPASLLKVPIMMTVLDMIDENPALAATQLRFEAAAEDVVPNVRGTQHLTPGQTYGIMDVVRRMIVYSDNDAANLLLRALPGERLLHTYGELGLPTPKAGEVDTQVTVKQYSGAFRMLYNATFLTRRSSDEALRTLTEVEFRDGIVAGVPAGVTVAHKFGERGVSDDVMQLHDCGIVYSPGHPYLLCVMTRGRSVEQLSGVIAELSRATYVSVGEQTGSER